MLGTTLKNDQYFSMRVLVIVVEEYFRWVFDDSQPLEDFPAEILEVLDYCDHNRQGEPPELYNKYR